MGLKQSRDRLFEKLMHIQKGIRKHGKDPSFPDLDRIGDIEARARRLGETLRRATASRVRAQKDAGEARREAIECDRFLARLNLAIQSWAGKRADVLNDFGIEPQRKLGRKARPNKTGGA